MASKKFMEQLRKRKETLAKGGSGNYKYFIFKEGVVRMRPLPVPEDIEFGFEVIMFYLGKDIGGVISPATWGEPCALYAKYQKLKAGDEKSKALADKMGIRRRFMVPHIKYLDEMGKSIDEKAGVKLGCLNGGQYQGLLDLYLDDEQGDFTDAKSGYDIKYKRVGSGQFDTVYSLLPCKPTPLAKQFRKIYSPEEMCREITPTYEETKAFVKQFFAGSKSESSSEQDEPARKKKKKKSSKF